MRPLLLGQVLAELRKDGLSPTQAKIQHALYSGRLDPVPLDSAGNRLYSPAHLDQLRAYLFDPPRRGRKPHGEAVPCP